MSRIFKYPLEIEQRQLVHMPQFARVLELAVDELDRPLLYALVDEDSGPVTPRVFRTVTTGETFNAADCIYVGMVTMKGWYRCFCWEQPAAGAQPDPLSDRFHSDLAEVRALPETYELEAPLVAVR